MQVFQSRSRGIEMEPKSYRPSNGTEGDAFYFSWCNRCKNDMGESCDILADSLAYTLKDAEYPKQLQYTEKGRPICTSFFP